MQLAAAADCVSSTDQLRTHGCKKWKTPAEIQKGFDDSDSDFEDDSDDSDSEEEEEEGFHCTETVVVLQLSVTLE